jgi:hypothetical protein
MAEIPEQAFSDASKLARRIGSKCMLDDGFFDTTRCAAYIEPILIERDTKLGTAEARIRELEQEREAARVSVAREYMRLGADGLKKLADAYETIAQLQAHNKTLEQEIELRVAQGKALNQDLEIFRAHNKTLRDLIKELEWCAIRSSESESTGAIHRYYCCPICRSDKRWEKHSPNCILDAALTQEEPNP